MQCCEVNCSCKQCCPLSLTAFHSNHLFIATPLLETMAANYPTVRGSALYCIDEGTYNCIVRYGAQVCHFDAHCLFALSICCTNYYKL